MLGVVILMVEIVPITDIGLIIEFVSAVVVLIAEIVPAKDTLITFENIVVVLTVGFVLAEVLFIVSVIEEG